MATHEPIRVMMDTLKRVRPAVPRRLLTPDRVESPLGTLHFADGVPTDETARRLYDQLDFIRGVEAFLNGYPGVSTQAICEGMEDAGVGENEVLVFSGLMDSRSLFLTANADTVYFMSILAPGERPLVVETPPRTLGIVDDLWWRWVTDFGSAGPDRGEGGRYLFVPPGYEGPLPAAGYFVHHVKTTRLLLLGRAFLENDDPAPAVARIIQTLRIYPCAPGGYGTSVADFLAGGHPFGEAGERTIPRFVEGTGRAMNTIPPTGFEFFEMLDALVQAEPAGALDPEIAGQLAAVGIVKGKDFRPDERMIAVLSDAAAVGNAAGRAVSFHPRPEEGFAYYGDGSRWINPLFVGGYDFLAPPPEITREGPVPAPADGARKLNARIAMFYVATGITPAMCMRIPNLGSQYLAAFADADGQPFDGGKRYRLALPPHIPAAAFWSVTVYDNQTRSMLQTGQPCPRAGSQAYPTPAATPNLDGSTTLSFGPTPPAGMERGNWIQTVPGKGWFAILRLYSPLEAFFDRTWRPGEVERVD